MTYQTTTQPDYITIGDDTGTIIYAAGFTPLTWVSNTTGNVRFYTHIDENCGTSSQNRTRQVTCKGNPLVTIVPITGLFTDAQGTIPYTGGLTASVYARPTVSTIYAVNALNGKGCPVTATLAITVSPQITFYADNDGDGYGNALVSQTSCLPSITGYVTNNTDCNDNDPLNWSGNNVFYQDNDGDGFGNALITILSCVAPAGFVANASDCNDANANINPSKPEIAYNGIDDNCDGNLDEGFPLIISSLITLNCGITLTNNFMAVHTTQVAGATGYRFKVTNMTSNSVQIIDRAPYFWFQFNEVTDLMYGTQYKVEVMVQRAGIYLGYYGVPCFVNTPAVTGTTNTSSSLSPASCGATLSSINTSVAANALPGVTGYRFRITNTQDATVQVLDRTVQWFTINMLSQWVYGMTYTIEVALKTTGSSYAPYGSICTLTTPAVPTIQSVCGTQIPKSFTNFATIAMSGVTNYKFEVTNVVTGAVQTLIKTLHYLSFRELTGIAPATQYSIRVSLKTAGAFSTYSAPCIVTSPAAARETFAEGETPTTQLEEFKALALPNPFSYNFAIDIKSSTTDKVGIKIYDMIGKLIEAREVEFTDINNVSIGENYPSGVYNVIIHQGENIKTLRVIKR